MAADTLATEAYWNFIWSGNLISNEVNMKVQLALDLLSREKALYTLTEAGQFVDIIEIGTSLLKLCGISIVEEIQNKYPNKPIFIDMKIIDGPEREANLMAMCNTEYYSMLGVASDTAIKKVLAIAAENGAKVVFDLQSVSDPVLRARELKALGAEYLCVHKNTDCGDNPQDAYSEYLAVRKASGLPVFLAGGIDQRSLTNIKSELNPDVVIVGGAILNASSIHDAAEKIGLIAHS